MGCKGDAKDSGSEETWNHWVEQDRELTGVACSSILEHIKYGG